MHKLSAIIGTFSLVLSVSVAGAFTITDSTTKSRDSDSTYASIQAAQNIRVPVPTALPIGTIIQWASDKDITEPEKWLECNGKNVDKDKYPELYEMMTKVPDYRSFFLRGGTAENVGQEFADSIESYNIAVPPSEELSHTHEHELDVSGNITVLGHGDTVYVPSLPESDSISMVQEEKTERVKTGTIDVPCGTYTVTTQQCEDVYEDQTVEYDQYQCYFAQNKNGHITCNNEKIQGEIPDKFTIVVDGERLLDLSNRCRVDATGLIVPYDYNCPLTTTNMNGKTIYLVAFLKVKTVSETQSVKVGENCTDKSEIKTRYCKQDVYENQTIIKDKEFKTMKFERTKTIGASIENRVITGSITEKALVGEYDGKNNETAPKHMYIRYFIRAIR